MYKYMLLFCGMLLIFTACASKGDVESPSADDAFRNALSNATNACANIALAQTKAKVAEADVAKEKGDNDAFKKAESEAMEFFKTEEPAYKALNDSNEAQNARIKEISDRRDAMERNAISANKAAWDKVLARVNQDINVAKEAYANCDPIKAQYALDDASAALDEMEGMIANAQSETVVITEQTVVVVETGAMYTVKKGDCLWNISKKEYQNPYMWPLIYWANKAEIKDPDLIFPGQKFQIVFDASEQERNKAINFAKNRGQWSLYDNK